MDTAMCVQLSADNEHPQTDVYKLQYMHIGAQPA